MKMRRTWAGVLAVLVVMTTGSAGVANARESIERSGEPVSPQVMDPSPQTIPSDRGGCSGTFVMPAKPAGRDWKGGQDITLVNCSRVVKFANVICHPFPTFEPDNVCWSYRIEPGGSRKVVVPSTRQVHDVDWY